MSVTSTPDLAAHVRQLADPAARDAAQVGSKAASLATAARAGLPVLPGLALTTRVHEEYLSAGRAISPALEGLLAAAWRSLHVDPGGEVVVRSSSTVEDVSASSMAGRFRTVLGVRDLAGFVAAVAAVLASADRVGGPAGPAPMGVLVQAQLDPARSGVMFGVDPVTGDASRVVVDAVSGGPDKLVSGQVAAQHYVITRRGRLTSLDFTPALRLGPTEHRRRLLGPFEVIALARLARRTQQVFGSPQDVEWAFDDRGTLWLLQSRPVTTAVGTVATGPVLGPGPLEETFPDPLGELEEDLWLVPLREGVVAAMTEAGVAHQRHLDTSPVVTTVGGRVAVDLELFGYVHHRSPLGPLDPRPAARQLRAAWRTGALRSGLPRRVAATVTATDAWLVSSDPANADGPQLVELLRTAREVLRGLHHLEVLAGTLLPPATVTAASVALHVLATANPYSTDAALVRAHPVVLAVCPPSVSTGVALPPVASVPAVPIGPLAEREQLRLRVRWVQELTARAARRLGRLLADRGVLEHHGEVALLRLEELAQALDAATTPPVLHERRRREVASAFGAPLPSQFRLADDGSVVPAERARVRAGFGGVPAGGGRGSGRVSHGTVRRPPEPGDVLVVRSLDPGLAGWLPQLAGLVSETGAALSHLAILAREYGVPTVVAVPEALQRFTPGQRLLVDGDTGEVRVLDPAEEATT